MEAAVFALRAGLCHQGISSKHNPRGAPVLCTAPSASACGSKRPWERDGLPVPTLGSTKEGG